MSCNGCRVLRKGCSESCVLRACLQWIDTAAAQGYATIFVAKFFGRAGLMSLIDGVSESQRPVLFKSLLFEACGRAINPVTGAVGLLATGNWHLCQEAAETVLRGGTLLALPELCYLQEKPVTGIMEDVDKATARLYVKPELRFASLPASMRRKACSSTPDESDDDEAARNVNPCLNPESPDSGMLAAERCRLGTASINSEGSAISSGESGGPRSDREPRLLNLFV